ncbi:MAG: formate dehydrogenase accessory sulfurtransferase FdhD [Promethearchaeota archaeon]
MASIRTVTIQRWKPKTRETLDDIVVREVGLRMILSDSIGEENFAFVRTIPAPPSPLIYGLLYTSRIINALEDVVHLRVSNQLAKVRITDECGIHEKLDSLRPTARLVTGVCGPEGALGTWRACDLPPIDSPLIIQPDTLLKAIKALNKSMPIYQQTGGTHGAALADIMGGLHIVAEDVGRHNAIDRVIGKALQKGKDCSTSLLLCTGRLTGDLVLKAAVARIPYLASIGAAVDTGVELAEAAGITLIGFVRGTRMNIYAHPERISFNGA